MYKDHDKNAPFFGLFRFHSPKQRSKDMASLSLMSHRERIIRDGLTNANISYEEFSKLDDHKVWQRLLSHVNMAHITMLIGEIKLENSKRSTLEETIQV